MTEIAEHATELLERLYDCAAAGEGESETVAAYLDSKGLGADYGFDLINLLDSNGYVEQSSGYGAAAGTITAHGKHAVQHLRAERADPKVRVSQLRTAMLSWLDDREAQRVETSSWEPFLEFAATEEGGGHSERDVRHAAEYLHEHQLIKAVKVAEEIDGWLRPTLTVAGRTCLTDFGGDVAEYLNRGHATSVITDNSTTNNTWVSDNHGNLNVAGDHISQSITNSGLDVAQLLELAGGIDQFAPVLQLPADVEREIVAAAHDLHAEASSASPDRGRLRQLVDKIYVGVKDAAPTVGKKVVLGLIDMALKALSGTGGA
ncbi:hypothetical protein ACGFIF_43020 [Kribbella sp. NPDC049174]|uniref:hypothetical protein n=1 Tax=Kribbella sp. NPDC049174 TaxID=3364112 RepID=UPI0037153C36